MADATQPINLTNHFLIAMPGMEDGTFARSVVYVCEHSEHGALGLIINKPGSISMADLFEKVDLPLARAELGGQPVFQGGPVQTERGFVLHEPITAEGLPPDESIYASTLTVPGGSLAAALAPGEWRACPAASVFSLAAARMGWTRPCAPAPIGRSVLAAWSGRICWSGSCWPNSCIARPRSSPAHPIIVPKGYPRRGGFTTARR